MTSLRELAVHSIDLLLALLRLLYCFANLCVVRSKLYFHIRRSGRVRELVHTMNSGKYPKINELPGYRQRSVPSYSLSSLTGELSRLLVDYGKEVGVDIDPGDLSQFLFTECNNGFVDTNNLRRDCDELVKSRESHDDHTPQYFGREYVLSNAERCKFYDLHELRKNKYLLYYIQMGSCAYCKKKLTFDEITIDHKCPKSRGGGNEYSNLQLMCGPCNVEKDDSLRFPPGDGS